MKPIEELRVGDPCWAYDLAEGRWELRPVVETYRFDYLGDVIEIVAGGERIQSTFHHPFWVVEGADLASRPEPDHIRNSTERVPNQPGRWVDAGDLRVGDVLWAYPDQKITVTELQSTSGALAVYNFQVADLHNYAVGELRILAHNNNTLCIGQNAESGRERENRVQGKLEGKFPDASVQREMYLRNSDGKIARDTSVTGEGRKIDHVVIENGQARFSVETTSKTADKSNQSAKEQRIRASGGTFVKDRQTGSLIDLAHILTRIVRVK